MPTTALKKQAKKLFQAQRLNEARALYEQLCHSGGDAGDAENWGDLGMIHGMLGAWEAAENCCRRAIALDGQYAAWHSNLGVVLEAQGRLNDAAASYRAALALSPNEPQIHANLGVVLRSQGKLSEARACYEQALRLAPNDGAWHLGLGAVHEDAGEPAAAQSCHERALELNPSDAEAHYGLGNVLLAREKPHDAMSCYREAIRLQPRHTGAHNNLARVQVAVGLLRDAADNYRKTIELSPNHSGARNNLGNVLYELGRHDEAVACFQEALRLTPDNAETLNNLGNVYIDKDRLTEAVEYFNKALALNPGLAEALNNLGRALRAQGRLGEGLEAFRGALRVNPSYAEAHSNLLFSLNYDADHTPVEIFAEHHRWDELHGHPGDVLSPPTNPPDPGRRLRVGYVSPDLRTHSVAYFLEPILAHHDPNRVEVHAYSDVPMAKRDATTERLQSLCQRWLDSCGLSDADLARQVRADGIDILVDLTGHTAHHRLRAFARRPAPVQITYLGYPNTTGLSAMDYRLTDAWADPPGQEAWHSEQLVRLAGGFLCYAPDETGAVGALPAHDAGHIRFGSFNNFSKLTPRTLDLWARLLHAVPDARLTLKNKSLRDAGAAARCTAEFASRGIGPDRLELIGWLPSTREHLTLYSRIDIGLDTFPYNGTTTTCEALWMGVPVIALEGDRHAARVGVSLLTRLGLEELIGRDEADYLDKAVRLAADRDRLAGLRVGLRARMLASGLCDGATFTRELEETYRKLWRGWCAKKVSTVGALDAPLI